MIYYSLQNKKTKQLIGVSALAETGVEDFCVDICYIFDDSGDNVWLVSNIRSAENALKTPNRKAWYNADYETPLNTLKVFEWKVVKVILNIEE